MSSDEPAATVDPEHPRQVGRERVPYQLIGLGCLGVLVAGIVWILVTGLVARARLESVQHQLHSVRTAIARGDIATARRDANNLRGDAASAHALTSGPAWWVASNVPYVGDPALTARVISQQADVLGAHVLPAVVDLAGSIATSNRVHNGGVQLAPLTRASPVLGSAASAAAHATQMIRAAPGSWLGPVSSGRDYAVRALHTVQGQLNGAARAIHLALPMLGQSGPRRYFIGFLNEAESRGVGGIPGAFAIAVVDQGRLTFEHFGSDTELQHVRADVHFNAQFNARYSQDDPAGVIQNSDISPDFRYAAQIWAGMWQAKTGQRIDGALAVDPTALGYLLYAAGDVRSASRDGVSADDIVGLTQQRQYRLYPGLSQQANAQRKTYLIGVAKSAVAKLTAGGHLSELLHQLTRATRERRIVLWSARAQEEREILAVGYGGALQAGTGPYAGMSVVNAAGSKLDFYLRRTLRYQRSGCAAGSTSTATITLTNTAPRSGLPPYVTVRADRPKYRVHPGDNLVLVTYYGTPGSRVRTVTLDGRVVRVGAAAENDLTAVTVPVELPVQRSRTLRITLSEPAVHGPLDVLRQPGVLPLEVRTSAPTCR